MKDKTRNYRPIIHLKKILTIAQEGFREPIRISEARKNNVKNRAVDHNIVRCLHLRFG